MLRKITKTVLPMALLLLSCQNKSQLQDVPSPYLIERVGQLNDSSSAIVHEEPAVERKKPEVDNMRGFDPASEDDMDDNGMSRYMENNDDSGWE